MGFRENLLHMRQEHNMTQEQLAMLVGVSRQSVTKWEADKSYPEMDKLMKMCDLFSCTLDELVKGDLTQRAGTPGYTVSLAAQAEDVTGYDVHKLSYAWKIAVGVSLIILGVGTVVWVDSTPAAVLLLFAGIAAGLLFIIPAAFSNGAFVQNHPYIVDFYTPELRAQIRRSCGYELAAGIAAILLGVGFVPFAEESSISFGPGFAIDGDSPVTFTVFWIVIAIGVGLIVHAALRNGRTDIEEYNLSALSELNLEEVAALVDEDRAAAVIANIKLRRRIGAACGIIMLLATIIALLILFLDLANIGESEFFWVPWPIGGLLCAVAAIAMTVLDSSSSDRESSAMMGKN